MLTRFTTYSLALYSTRRHASWFSKILYPFSQPNQSATDSYKPSGYNGNQCFLPVRSNDELSEVLTFNNRKPLILNFTVRGNDTCNKLTGALNRIVLLETDKKINIVDVETDYHDTREGMMRFGVCRKIFFFIACNFPKPRVLTFHYIYRSKKFQHLLQFARLSQLTTTTYAICATSKWTG